MSRNISYADWENLKKNELKPHLKRTWCIGCINAEFIAKMEQVLWLYQQEYNPLYPVVCFDERPCFLIGNKVEPIALQSGQVSREHYSYEKNGSCALLAAIEPKTGKRLAQVHLQRTKLEYTLFFQALARAYPDAIKIRIVQDNLNTHNTSSFYQHLPADEAFALAQRFEQSWALRILRLHLAKPNVVDRQATQARKCLNTRCQN